MRAESKPLLLALEIGGTKLQAALGTPGGAIVECVRGSAPAGGAGAILEWFGEHVPPLMARARGDLRGIGVGFGGPVDSAAGKVLVSHQVEGWEGVELARWFEERFGLRARIFNDSNAAGWAEYVLGAGRGTRHFMYSNIGSGIGGAVVIDGRLHDGQGYGAGEVGHTYVADFESDDPHAVTKLENVCSGWAIERRLRAATDLAAGSPLHELCGGNAAALTCAMLGQAAREGDARALAEIDRVAQAVGTALANAVTLFHPERIALGGGVSFLGEVLLEPIRRYADTRAFGPFQGRFSIVPCELGESVVLAGALLLAGAAAV